MGGQDCHSCMALVTVQVASARANLEHDHATRACTTCEELLMWAACFSHSVPACLVCVWCCAVCFCEAPRRSSATLLPRGRSRGSASGVYCHLRLLAVAGLPGALTWQGAAWPAWHCSGRHAHACHVHGCACLISRAAAWLAAARGAAVSGLQTPKAPHPQAAPCWCLCKCAGCGAACAAECAQLVERQRSTTPGWSAAPAHQALQCPGRQHFCCQQGPAVCACV